jgi:sugar-specific transcriptional regulator TrmB
MTSLGNVVNHLTGFGLSSKEAQVYAVLLKLNSAKASEISSIIRLDRLETYRALQKLVDAGLVETSMDRPKRYIALSLEKSLDQFIEESKTRTAELVEKKVRLLQELRRITVEHPEVSASTFTIIHGRRSIHEYASELIKSAQKEICAMTTWIGLLRTMNSGIDDVYERSAKRGVRIRTICEINEKNIKAAKRFLGFSELRHVPAQDSSRLVIVDDRELVIIPNPRVTPEASKEICLWTNNHELLRIVKKYFDASWSAAIDGLTMIKRVEKNKPT